MLRADLPEPMVLVFEGELNEYALEEALADAQKRVDSEPRPLIVDCKMMTGYTREARNLFVKWNRDNRDRVPRVAIITIKPMWRIVISAMSLASSQKMQAFDDLGSARRWALGDTDDDDSNFDAFVDG